MEGLLMLEVAAVESDRDRVEIELDRREDEDGEDAGGKLLS
jgi:hypothetical protein